MLTVNFFNNALWTAKRDRSKTAFSRAFYNELKYTRITQCELSSIVKSYLGEEFPSYNISNYLRGRNIPRTQVLVCLMLALGYDGDGVKQKTLQKRHVVDFNSFSPDVLEKLSEFSSYDGRRAQPRKKTVELNEPQKKTDEAESREVKVSFIHNGRLLLDLKKLVTPQIAREIYNLLLPEREILLSA